jgi:hypothetical protein
VVRIDVIVIVLELEHVHPLERDHPKQHGLPYCDTQPGSSKDR